MKYIKPEISELTVDTNDIVKTSGPVVLTDNVTEDIVATNIGAESYTIFK